MLPFLLTALFPRMSVRGRTWLEKEIAAMAPGPSAEVVLHAFAAASLYAGRAQLKLSADELQRMRALDADLSLADWTTDVAARAALLLKLAEAAPLQFADMALACYEHGDARAQQGWLRALPMLPQPQRFLSTALDACRTTNAQQFEAIACDNPYPARYFPERNFNQLVMQALDSSVALSRIVGVSRRSNPDLVRMVGDYAAERKMAGRSAPPDLALVLTPVRIVNAS